MAKTKIKPLTEDELLQVSIRIAISRSEFMTEMPRFYKAFDFVNMYPDQRIPTLAVAPLYEDDSKELTGFHDFLWNPEFCSLLSEKQLVGVQMHELLHIMLGHTTIRRPDIAFTVEKGMARAASAEDAAKAEMWNIATDLAINDMIKKWLKDPSGLQDVGLFPSEGNYSNLPTGKNAEYYYKELLKQHKQDMQDAKELLKKLKDSFGKGAVGSHSEWVDSKGKKAQPREGSQGIGKIEGEGEKGEEEKDGDGTPTLDDIKKELEEIAEDLGVAGTTAGNSGGTTQYVDLSKGKERKTPSWMKKVNSASTHGFEVQPISTRKVPNRRFGILFPGKKRIPHQNKVLIAVDVSGSINRQLLNIFTEHLNKMKKHAEFDLFFFNHSLIDVQGNEVSPDKAEKCLTKWKTGMNFYVGGGTSFEPIMQFWNRVYRKYDGLFIFTDGEANYETPPKSEKYVNWILYSCSSWYRDAIKHGKRHQMSRSGEEA